MINIMKSYPSALELEILVMHSCGAFEGYEAFPYWSSEIIIIEKPHKNATNIPYLQRVPILVISAPLKMEK